MFIIFSFDKSSIRFFTGLGLWAWERVYPCAQCSEPRGSGPWPIRTRIHGDSLHLCWWCERRSNLVSKPLRSDCERGWGTWTGYCHHTRLRPRLSPNQASLRTNKCDKENNIKFVHMWNFTAARFLEQIFSTRGHKEILLNREIFWWTKDCASLGQRREQHLHHGGHCSGWT